MFNIGLASVSEIIAQLGYNRVCAGWVPGAGQFVPEINIARLEACQ
jgi:hypothetical protein